MDRNHINCELIGQHKQNTFGFLDEITLLKQEQRERRKDKGSEKKKRKKTEENKMGMYDKHVKRNT